MHELPNFLLLKLLYFLLVKVDNFVAVRAGHRSTHAVLSTGSNQEKRDINFIAETFLFAVKPLRSCASRAYFFIFLQRLCLHILCEHANWWFVSMIFFNAQNIFYITALNKIENMLMSEDDWTKLRLFQTSANQHKLYHPLNEFSCIFSLYLQFHVHFDANLFIKFRPLTQ